MIRDDLISRQAVLDALNNIKYSNEFCEEHHIDWSINLSMAHIVVNKLKPVTSQQRTGRWIEYVEPDDAEPLALWRCENCDIVERRKTLYCPCCGTRMEVEE